jgi:hypothetical protein
MRIVVETVISFFATPSFLRWCTFYEWYTNDYHFFATDRGRLSCHNIIITPDVQHLVY